jgi:pimeloyl-ACP methyl ester carboxylesterase
LSGRAVRRGAGSDRRRSRRRRPRPSSGDLDAEVAALADAADGALVVGVSGGATLGLALAASGTRLAGAVDPQAVARDLAMFRRFEPDAPRAGQGPVVVTVGADSPAVRHEAARALHDRLGLEVRVLPGAGPFVHHDAPGELAAVIRSVLAAS